LQAEDGIRDDLVTGVQTCALPIWEALAIPLDGNADAAERDGISQTPGPEGRAARANIRQLLKDQIAALPDYYQAVFRLRAVDEQIGRASCRERESRAEGAEREDRK